MKRATAVSLSLTVVLLGALAAPALAKGKKAPTAPGKYTEWGEDIDQLEVVETFATSDYSRVVVEPFDGSATPLPESSDNTYAPVKQVLADTATPLVEGMQEAEGLKLQVAAAERGSAAERGALLIRGKVLSMDPGSRAKRYWGGFGAGAAVVELSGEVVDAASGKVLLRFTQARRSGMGVGGGDYANLLNRNLRKIGEDVATILQAF